MHPDDRISCARCGIVFPRPHLRGRRPIYCNRTCRQRAYEARRRAAYRHHLRVPAVPRPANRMASFHEAGRIRGVRHALRPDQPVNQDRRRQTLCGTHVWSMSRHRFGLPDPPMGRDCEVCTRIVKAYPLSRPVDPAPDLAELKHILLATRSSFVADDAESLHRAFDHLFVTAIGRDPVSAFPTSPGAAA
jgi:hypothetical protein